LFDENGNKYDMGWCDDFGKERKQNIKKLANARFKEHFTNTFKDNYDRAILSYKGITAVFQSYNKEDSFIKLILIPDKYVHSAYTVNSEQGLALKSLQIDKSFILSSSGFDLNFVTNKIFKAFDTIKSQKTKINESIKALDKGINESKELLASIPKIYPKQELLNALRNDKEIIVDKIADKDFSWQPSYKSIGKNTTTQTEQSLER